MAGEWRGKSKPYNHDPVAKDFLDRAYVKELKNETDTLYFKSDYWGYIYIKKQSDHSQKGEKLY